MATRRISWRPALAVLLAAGVGLWLLCTTWGWLQRPEYPNSVQAQEPDAQAGQAPAAPPVPVGVAEVIQAQVSARQTFVGSVLHRRKTTVGSAVDGRVLEVPVTEGEWLTAGETLAQLRTKDLEIELAAAEAELELRRQELAELENGSRPEEIAQAEAQLNGTKAMMSYAQAKARRAESLSQQGRNVVSLEELEEATSAAVAAEQNHVAAQAAYELAVKGPREEKIAQVRARVQVQQEIINQIEDRIDKFTVRMPFDGYVVWQYIQAGAWLSRGEQVADVVELDPVEVTIMVPERHIARLRKDHPAWVRVRDALPEQEFVGTIARIVPQADLKARTFPVKVWLDNPRQGDGDHLLKSGMVAHVTLEVGTREALLVPKDALVLGGPEPLVYVVEHDGQTQPAAVRPVPVEVGVAEGSLIQVSGALQAGQQVVDRGNERLRPGQAVTILKKQSAGEKTE